MRKSAISCIIAFAMSLVNITEAQKTPDNEFEAALQTKNVKDFKEASETVEKLISTGKSLYNSGQLEEALKHYYKALAIAQEKLGKNSTPVASIYTSLALTYMKQGKYEKSAQNAWTAGRIFRRSPGRLLLPYQASTILLTAGKTYRDIGNLINAQKVLLEAIKYIDEQKSPRSPQNTKLEFDVYSTLIHVYLISKEQKHAEEYFNIAIKKAASLPEKERYKYSGLLYRNMTFNCIENGLLALTIRYAQQAIRTQKDKAAAYDMAEINLSLARVYYWENDCARTLILCQNAENFIKQVSGTDKQLLLTKLYIQYANTYQRNKQYSQAITKYRQAIQLHGDRFSDEYPFPSILYTSLALCYQNLKEYAESEKLLKKALRLAKNDYQTATAYFVLGRLYIAMKKFDKSVKAFDHSLSAFDTAKNIDNSYKARAYWGKARALHAQKNYTAAVKNANQALQLSKKYSPLYTSIKSKIADWKVKHQQKLIAQNTK